MKIGIYCSSISPELWMGLYSNLAICKVDFEMMFVGPNEPQFQLPGNMKFLKATVKPAQCYFIGAKKVQGDYLFNVADDMSFTPGALDILAHSISTHSGNTIVTPRYGKHPMGFYGQDESCILPVGGLMRRELWDSIGIDKNFIALYWDVDMAMENYSRGGKVIICESAVGVDDKVVPDRNQLCNLNDGVDRRFFYACWAPQGFIRRTRVNMIKPLVMCDSIYTESQGNHGTWP